LGFSKYVGCIWSGPLWGAFRLPDGRGVFSPWVVPWLVYVVPNDDEYARIRRMTLLWGLIVIFGGLFLGPLAINILLWGQKELAWWVFFLEAALCLVPILVMYCRWAVRVTRNWPILDQDSFEDALDPSAAPTYAESVRRNLAPFSVFALCSIWIFTIVGTAFCLYLVAQEPQDWILWLCSAVLALCSGLILWLVRIKLQGPRPDLY